MSEVCSCEECGKFCDFNERIGCNSCGKMVGPCCQGESGDYCHDHDYLATEGR